MRSSTRARLEARGIRNSDIRTIVLSHLHFDHVANAECFPQAEFLRASRAGAYGRAYFPVAGLSAASRSCWRRVRSSIAVKSPPGPWRGPSMPKPHGKASIVSQGMV
ncbi:MBL fold metallo-hydrolase [Shinella sp. S4-D37]|uniref:MBL fold metallo-hydrolase n=1 Tax=Shinella sp. S4-D37 TaxID=3161999 RepID=UPI003466350B